MSLESKWVQILAHYLLAVWLLPTELLCTKSVQNLVAWIQQLLCCLPVLAEQEFGRGMTKHYWVRISHELQSDSVSGARKAKRDWSCWGRVRHLSIFPGWSLLRATLGFLEAWLTTWQIRTLVQMFQRSRWMLCLISLPRLEIIQCHFCHILMVLCKFQPNQTQRN